MFLQAASSSISTFFRRWRLTIFGRSVLLIFSELIANVIVWTATGLLFGRHSESSAFLSLSVLAWTIGLRHGLDADHISAIDNATRGLISLGQLSVTCGLFFSLGHSTIVIAVNVAIAISTDIYDKFINVTDIGGIIGSAVSSAFLFIIGVANSIILYGVIKDRRKRRNLQIARINDDNGYLASSDTNSQAGKSIMMRILGPVTTFVNRPWKMYPVGVLFGLGFDTASSIALLAVSALAKKDTHGNGIPQGYIVIFPFMFTVGMTLVDSVDSILMLYSYSGFRQNNWALYERVGESDTKSDAVTNSPEPSHPYLEGPSLYGATDMSNSKTDGTSNIDIVPASPTPENPLPISVDVKVSEDINRRLIIKQNTMSGLSIILTLISILVAFSISLITFMGLIESVCQSCQDAANVDDGGGLAGSWWRGWVNANDQSGYIGAAIVGGFVFVLIAWHGVLALLRYVHRLKTRNRNTDTSMLESA